MDAILSNWPVIVSLLCGLLLTAVVLALIFMPDFRKDVTAQQGKASLLKVVSVEGVIVVLLSGMLLFGLLYPLWKNEKIAGLRTQVGEIPSLRSQVKELEVKLKNSTSTGSIENLPKAVASLEPNSDESRQIRGLARDRQGPWSPYQRSTDILISVPGGLPSNSVLGCPELYEKDLQLISTYEVNGQVSSREPLDVHVSGLIFEASNCRDLLQYDLQLNCAAAAELFSQSVIECDSENNPRWGVMDRLLSASAVVH